MRELERGRGRERKKVIIERKITHLSRLSALCLNDQLLLAFILSPTPDNVEYADDAICRRYYYYH